MTHAHSRSGFSLVETMVASSIATIIMVALASTYLFCHRMFSQTMAEAEASLAIREIRDKLLFHAGPGLDSGLLTGKASSDTASITMNWTTTPTDAPDLDPAKIRLVWRTDANGLGNFFNERIAHESYNIKWFKPGGDLTPFLSPLSWTQTVDLPRINLKLVNASAAGDLASAWILLPQ